MLSETNKPVVGSWFKETTQHAVAAHLGCFLRVLTLLAAGVVGWIVGLWSV